VYQPNILILDVDPAFQAQVVHRPGFGALVVGMFGMGWLGSGLGMAHAFTPTVIVLFDVFRILLLGIFHLLHSPGKVFAPKLPGVTQPANEKDQPPVYGRGYFGIYGNRNSQYDGLRLSPSRPGPCLGRFVVELHFLPLGKIFRQHRYYFWGIAIDAVVQCLRDLVPFQYTGSLERRRDRSSTLG
jgi:hypothetical protein